MQAVSPWTPRREQRSGRLALGRTSLALDRCDIQFATKEICRDMSSPTQMSVGKLRRLASYLLEYPSLVWTFEEVDELLEYLGRVLRLRLCGVREEPAVHE